MTTQRVLYSSGSPFEAVVGYSRAVQVGPFLTVSGTTASSPEGPVGGSDPNKQATEAIKRIAYALKDAGADLSDVVRTRVYLTDITHFDAIAQAHLAAFAEIRPATTFLEISGLASPALLVEIEADAIVADRL